MGPLKIVRTHTERILIVLPGALCEVPGSSKEFRWAGSNGPKPFWRNIHGK